MQIDASTPAVPTLTLNENPASGAHVAGSTLYYRPGGSGAYRVSAASSDAESGIASIDFPAIANTSGGGSIANPGPYQSDYNWDGSTSASGAQTVTVANAAGLTSTASFDLTPDPTAPTGQTISISGGFDSTGRSNTGGRYDPISNSWTPTSTVNAPAARDRHTAVWTGSRMIVWGGDASGPVAGRR